MKHRKHMIFVLLLLLTGAWVMPCSAQAIPGGSLNPDNVAKYSDPLVIPPIMQPNAGPPKGQGKKTTYQISVRQFSQNILPSPHPATTVWSYGRFTDPRSGPKANQSFNYPAFTIETVSNHPIRVRWVNELVDKRGRYLPHLLPVDQTLHWANPPKECIEGNPRTDCRGYSQEPYLGPVPIVPHVHGSHVNAISDGYPEAWWLPNAYNIPSGYATAGSNYDSVIPAPPGSAWYEYDNSQRAATLWYHDHALGITRLNVYAGPAGFYMVRDNNDTGLANNPLGLPAPATLVGQDPNGDPEVRGAIREIPIAIQDRSFNIDGSLFYPDNRDFFEGLPEGTLSNLGVEFIPDTDVSPIWNPEFFGNMMVTERVNGEAIKGASDNLKNSLQSIQSGPSLDVLRGIEGDAAHSYFSVFDHLIVAQKEDFAFHERNRRPPLDKVNCLLSFLYTLVMHDVRSALEAVGLDPAVGFLHRDRPGRPGLALDLMEEFRPFIADRLALSLINLNQVQKKGFRNLETGAVLMDDDTRKAVLVAYQKRKQDEIMHPFIEEKVSLGLLFHVQALLMARHVRGDLDGYPPFIWK